MDAEKKNVLWMEIKRSYTFPEGKEPYQWVMEKIHSCWRTYKSDLKVEYFDGKTLANAINNGPDQVPQEMWKNLVNFWASDKGKERSRVGIENRSKLKMCHYAGTKAFARVRAEEEAKGKKMDKLQTWLKTHTPKEGSKLDNASAKAKQSIDDELARLDDDQDNAATRDEIFVKAVGEDKNGYAKTFGLGVKLPRSRAKRCALEEESKKIEGRARTSGNQRQT